MEVVALDAGRGALIALLAVALARLLAPCCARHRVVALLAAWWLMPALVLAYAWAALPFPFMHDALLRQGLHGALCALRFAPVALAIAWCVPAAPWSAEALHLARQLGPRRRAAGLPHPGMAWCLQGPGRRWLVAGLVVLPLAMGEFELGSRLAVDAWAVRLFDAQAGGGRLADILMRIAPLVAVQILAVAAAWLLASRHGAHQESLPQQASLINWAVLVLGSLALLVFPVVMLVGDGVRGFAAVIVAPGILGEVAASLLFGLAGGTIAWLAAGLARNPHGSLAVGGIAAIGLCGGLPLGFLLLAAAPAAVLATPLPLVAALALQALPFALVFRRWTGTTEMSWSVARPLLQGDARQQTSAAALHWRLRAGRCWWAWAALAWWCTWELAASAILHPLDMTPVLVLLYHFMHYGDSAALTARLLLAVLIPLLVLAALLPLARWWSAREALRG